MLILASGLHSPTLTFTDLHVGTKGGECHAITYWYFPSASLSFSQCFCRHLPAIQRVQPESLITIEGNIGSVWWGLTIPVYMQSLSGGGGWPMSVWLTPELKPIYGGTYYPPNNRYFGRPSFPQLLVSIASQVCPPAASLTA